MHSSEAKNDSHFDANLQVLQRSNLLLKALAFVVIDDPAYVGPLIEAGSRFGAAGLFIISFAFAAAEQPLVKRRVMAQLKKWAAVADDPDAAVLIEATKETIAVFTSDRDPSIAE